MIVFREIIGLIVFLAGCYLLIEAIGTADWILVAASVTAFVMAYFIWPSRKRGQRHESSSWLDGLEFVIELPVEIVFWLFKGFFRLFKHADDIDI